MVLKDEFAFVLLSLIRIYQTGKDNVKAKMNIIVNAPLYYFMEETTSSEEIIKQCKYMKWLTFSLFNIFRMNIYLTAAETLEAVR